MEWELNMLNTRCQFSQLNHSTISQAMEMKQSQIQMLFGVKYTCIFLMHSFDCIH